MSDLIDYAEASELLRLAPGTLRAMVSKGTVPHLRLGPRLVRFSKTSLERWLSEQEVRPEADVRRAEAGFPHPESTVTGGEK
jgi:excisionase family DNA binding protein